MHSAILTLVVISLCAAGTSGCEKSSSSSSDTDTDVDADTDIDTDTDADTDADSDSNSDSDVEPIEMDCSSCPAVGGTLADMQCAIDLCETEYVVQNEYEEIGNSIYFTVEDTYEAVERFGATTNDLAPRKNNSYALMATGPATGTNHGGYYSSLGVVDPWAENEPALTYDTAEWHLTLTAPEDAKAFRFKYVFFSEEYDDYISTPYNDKFYVLLEADSTNGGAPTLINFTACREPMNYYDFICAADYPGCEEGERYCYIAINSAFSDCCWYNDCPDGYSSAVGTDITGTGFECSESWENDFEYYGSSTGWLQTSWPIAGGETFSLTFHIHDTNDSIFDSEVILDAFEFLKDSEQGTVVVVKK